MDVDKYCAMITRIIVLVSTWLDASDILAQLLFSGFGMVLLD